MTDRDLDGERLLDSVTRNCWIVAVAGASGLTVLGKANYAVSFLLGAGVSILLLASSRYAVARIFQPGARGHAALALLASLVRWSVAAFVVWLAVRSDRCSMPVFAAGATVVSAVLFGTALRDWRLGVREERLRSRSAQPARHPDSDAKA